MVVDAQNNLIPQTTLQNHIKTLINTNGGWFVMGDNSKRAIGEIFEYEGMTFRVVGKATAEDATTDCKTLGIEQLMFYNYYYKVATD